MAGPIKILYVIDQFRNPHAGTEGQLYQLVQHLDRSSFQPHFLVFTSSDFLEDQGFACDYTVLGHQSLSSPRTWIALWRAARRFYRDGYRLAHIFFNDPSIICPPVFSLVGIKSLISRRDMGYWYTPAMRRLLRITRHCVRGALVNSEAVKALTAQVESIPVDRIHVIYNGYVSRRKEQDTHEQVPELEQLKARGLVLAGLVANIRPIKRIEDLVCALGKIRSDCPQLHVVVIGAGDPSALMSEARTLGVADRVHFLGARSDVEHCLSYLDIGVLCSESEGFSNSIVEYMQAGLPVICTETGGNPEAVTHGQTGLLYPVGDVDALAAHLLRLASSPEEAAAMGQNSLKSALSRFSVAEMVGAHEAVYQSIGTSAQP